MGVALVIKIPYLVHMFLKMTMPFVDPVTRAKLHFNPEVVKEGLMGPDSLMQEGWGGDVDFQYDHDKYWPSMVRMTAEKRAREKEAWRALGGKVGLSEFEIKTKALEALKAFEEEKPVIVAEATEEKAVAPPVEKQPSAPEIGTS